MDDIVVEQLMSWYRDNFIERCFTGKDGRSVRYAVQLGDGDKGYVVIVSGRTEFLEKFLEVARDLQDTGYRLCLYDHSGQGASQRVLSDRNKGHIEDFWMYVEDLHHLIATCLVPDGSEPVVLLSHSMGGTIGTLFSSEYSSLVRGLILVSPMFQITTGTSLPAPIVEMISRTVCFLGQEESYVWGGKPFDPELPFESNELTTDPTRFRRTIQMVQKNRRLQLGSPTFGWLSQAYRAMRAARQKGPELTCPVLMLQGGDDVVVGLPEIDAFCESCTSCKMAKFPGARHELLMETDSVREAVLAEIKLFLSRL